MTNCNYGGHCLVPLLSLSIHSSVFLHPLQFLSPSIAHLSFSIQTTPSSFFIPPSLSSFSVSILVISPSTSTIFSFFTSLSPSSLSPSLTPYLLCLFATHSLSFCPSTPSLLFPSQTPLISICFHPYLLHTLPIFSSLSILSPGPLLCIFLSPCLLCHFMRC